MFDWLKSLREQLGFVRKPAKAVKPASRRLGVESLEDRTTPATLTLEAGGILTYAAGLGETNNLTVSVSGSTYTFTDASGISINGGSNTATFNAATVNGVAIDLGNNNDTASIRSTLAGDNVTVSGGLGNDTINISSTGT